MSENSPYQCPDPTCNQNSLTLPSDVIVGDIIECSNCAAEVEVISLEPVTFRLIEEDK